MKRLSLLFMILHVVALHAEAMPTMEIPPCGTLP